MQRMEPMYVSHVGENLEAINDQTTGNWNAESKKGIARYLEGRPKCDSDLA